MPLPTMNAFPSMNAPPPSRSRSELVSITCYTKSLQLRLWVYEWEEDVRFYKALTVGITMVVVLGTVGLPHGGGFYRAATTHPWCCGFQAFGSDIADFKTKRRGLFVTRV